MNYDILDKELWPSKHPLKNGAIFWRVVGSQSPSSDSKNDQVPEPVAAMQVPLHEIRVCGHLLAGYKEREGGCIAV